MRRLLALLLVSFPALAAGPATTNNDDSCDIAVQPAATLLLPYFDVDFDAPASSSTTTLFTIQNVSPTPAIANVTIWTDWGFPAVNFPIHLTGYDVQGINLYDLFTSGAIPATACGGGNLSAFVTDLRFLFTTGKGAGATVACTAAVGSVHPHAIGYVTVDLVSTCMSENALSPNYFAHLLYDNVLTGDYQQLQTSDDKHAYASAGPLVHIRAVPEGGPAGAVAATSLPYTFYDRFAPSDALRKSDRRQPLPAVFAPRYINGGTGAFNTSLKIWREGITLGACSGAGAARSNSGMLVTDLVRFDEHENATVVPPPPAISAAPPGPPGLPATLLLSAVNTTVLPPFSTSGDVSGWIYLNLDNQAMKGRASQNWVMTTMFAAPTYASEGTAVALGNGCSPAVRHDAQIAPAP
jgi:hypothetical protein